MSEAARKQIEAVRAYQAQHPEIDWETHVVYLEYTDDGDWVGVGHVSWGTEQRINLLCCDPGNCPTHKDELKEKYGYPADPSS